MKLSTLVHYRNLLEKYSLPDMTPVVNEHAGHARHLISDHEIQFPALTQQIVQNFDSIVESFDQFSETIESVKNEIQQLINEIEKEYFVKSYQLYEQSLSEDQADYVLDRKIQIADDVFTYLDTRTKSYGNWHHSGMIIRPGSETWIENLVACDPLYLVDKGMDFLEPAMKRFNEDYQRRLRTHLLRPYADGDMLKNLPDGQIGFCLAYNFFNYTPFEVTKAYLEEIYHKLKPGGTLAFTFNNCDRSGAVELVERNFMCYTPGKLLLALCESLGYQIRLTYQLDAACTWAEISKPGQLTSLRGGQSLARIVAKSK